ncbi:hypothetical protein [Candidiatus Paracoxiella cheracis]|uniref:hypothetical protein n=1 Tax=Candidiatus Paracoxiella cheracis TaxID=3405120 RepID=UPI003BF608FB
MARTAPDTTELNEQQEEIYRQLRQTSLPDLKYFATIAALLSIFLLISKQFGNQTALSKTFYFGFALLLAGFYRTQTENSKFLRRVKEEGANLVAGLFYRGDIPTSTDVIDNNSATGPNLNLSAPS